jgi:hypothetical protein
VAEAPLNIRSMPSSPAAPAWLYDRGRGQSITEEVLMMATPRTAFGFALLVLWLGFGHALAQERELLYPTSVVGKLQRIVATMRQLSTQKIPYEQISRTTEYFVRIAPRKHVLTENNTIQDSAILGTKPLVFVTIPESVYGRSLLEIYADIGYEAEDIIRWQRNEDMIAIVFRYPEEIGVSAVRDGRLPDNWDKKVYVPTWDNVFALFSQLADSATVEPNKRGEFAPEWLFFRSSAEKGFVLGFPDAGKERIKTAGYTGLRAVGGADWVYRQLLETKLSIFEHFRGNGRTHNEVSDPAGQQPEAGLLEFVGPNRKIKMLPEVAIVHLGRLTIEDTYSAGGTASVQGK